MKSIDIFTHILYNKNTANFFAVLEIPERWRLLPPEPEESAVFFFLRNLSEGGDSMDYITFEQLLLFSGFVLSLISTIFVILSFYKKK